jgi:hypothetical protein
MSPRFGFPVWEDEALTKTWRNEQAHAPPVSDEPNCNDPDEWRKRIPANPADFKQAFRRCLELPCRCPEPLRLTILARGIQGW